MNDFIKVHHTHIIVPNYERGSAPQVEKALSLWDGISYKYIPKGFYIEEETNTLRLPRGLDIGYLEKTFNMSSQVYYEHDKAEKCSIRLKVEPKNDLQRKAISYLIGKGDFYKTASHSQLSLNLDTGDGKTFCVVAALTFLKLKSLIITPVDNIKKQWFETFVKMTDIDEKYIYNIEGSKSITKLLNSKGKLPFKIFLVNHRTISSYAKKHGWDSIAELFKKLEIGVKVYDEAHKEFHNMMMIDLFTNTKKTFYLTANFERSEYNENKIFELCFKNILKYGRETKKEKRKHIIYVPVFFNSKPSLEEQSFVVTKMGFSSNNYIKYHLENSILFDVIDYTLKFFSTKCQKTLLLFSTIEATEEFYKYAKDILPDKTIGIYHSKISEEDKANIKDCDIIVSTPKSMGTGTDIKGLQAVIMTEPYSSNITANQTSGRLRELPDGKYTFYIELVDNGFPSVKRLYKKRLEIFKQKCHSMVELKYK